MRRRTLAIASCAGLLATAACAIRLVPPEARSAAQATPGAAREAPRIEVDAAHAEVQAGRAVLVDVRGPESFRTRRAAGAILVTLDELEQSAAAAMAKLPAGKRPILYCT